MKVLMQAKLIPDGSTVIKRTGSYTQILKHELLVYQNQNADKNQPIKISGCFLVNERGNIEQIDSEKEFIWVVEWDELREWMIEKEEEIEPPQ